MVRKIGNIAFLLCLIGSFIFGGDSQISLFVTDLQGHSFDYIETQQPFILHVHVKNMKEDIDRNAPIPGAKTCVVDYGSASQTTSIMNGVRDDMISHQYVVRGKKEGEFVLGPIRGVGLSGQTIVSNSVKVLISDTPLVHKSKIKPFFLRYFVDKDAIYLGQKITVTTQFYYRNQYDHLEMSEPSYAGCSVVSRSKNYKVGKETIEGNEFLYKEIQTVLYPQEAGNLDLLPARAVFTDGTTQRGFFGIRSLQQKQLVSKFLSVDVMPLPEHPDGEEIMPIGNFTDVFLNVEVGDHEVGKPVMAQYIIQGEGNFELISSPQVEVHQSMRCYSSTFKIDEMANGERKKTFELVIQGSNPGTFTIPKQSFSYFDPEKNKYKKLYTKPVKIIFTGEAIEMEPEKLEPLVKDAQAQPRFNFQDWQINKIYQGRGIHLQQSRGVSPDLFLKIVMGLFLLLLLCLCFIHYRKLIQFLWQHLLAQKILIYACLFLMRKNKKKSRKIDQLYALFGFFIKLYGFDIHNEFGIAFLQRINCTEAQQKDWKEYMNRLAHDVYAKKNDAVKVELFIIGQNDLHAQGRKMFQVFFKKIKTMRRAMR